jgi:ankyrin repeat protein
MSRRLIALMLALAATLGVIGVVSARFRQQRLDLDVIRAVDRRDSELVRQALDRGGRTNARVDFPWPLQHYSYSALSEAVRQSDLAIVRVLLERGADPNATGRWHLPALQIARELGLGPMAALLKKHGARD